MRNIAIVFTALFLCSCGGGVFAPDRVMVDGETAYVADRTGLSLLAVDIPSGKESAKVAFSDPVSDMALSGGDLWCVTEGATGGLYRISPSSMEISATLPLNGYLSSLAVGSDGDIWVTDRFKGKLYKMDAATMEIVSCVDAGREPCDVFVTDSLVYVLNALPMQSALDYPIASAIYVFDKESGAETGCIMLPNGSTDAVSMERSTCGRYLYVSHLLSRYQLPTSQITRGWICTNAMSVIDLMDGSLLSTVLLDAVDRGAANPGTIRVSASDSIYVALRGADQVIGISESGLIGRLDSLNVLSAAGSVENPADVVSFLHNLRNYTVMNGKGLRDMDLYNDRPLVAAYFTGEVKDADGKFDFQKGKPLTSTKEGRGEMYFFDANMSYQGWLSCASCHPHGRTDGLNWDLVNDGICNPKNTKSLLLSHQTPPVMVSGIRKDAYTAVRSGFKHIGFLAVNEEISSDVDAFLISMKPVASPYLGDEAFEQSAARGQVLFDANCAGCHSGQYHTNMGQYAAPWNKDAQCATFDVTSLVELWRTAPYLYDGRTPTLDNDDVFHFTDRQLTPAEREDMVNYMLTL